MEMEKATNNAAKHFIKRKGRNKEYPLIHKNFGGATHPYVWCRIIDIYDDKFMIEFYSGTQTEINQIKFISNYKEWEAMSAPIPFHDELYK